MDQNDFEKNLQALAGEVDERAPLPVDEVPIAKTQRRLYWIIGLLGAIVLGGLELGVLMIGNEPEAPAPPASVLQAFNDNPCVQRMGVLMTAIARYASDKGAPPVHLTDLGADYLTVPPVDPITGQPYVYTVNGQSVSLACPTTPNDQPSSTDRQT